jgi:hypothetical protein
MFPNDARDGQVLLRKNGKWVPVTHEGYTDWRWAGSGVNPSGAPAAATLTEVNANEWLYVFANNSVMAFPDQQIPHDYAEGTDLVPHLHWAPTTTDTYTGTWTLVVTSWLSVATGSGRQAAQTTTISFNAAMTAGQMQSADFSAVLSGADRRISSCLTATLKLALTSGTGCALLGLDAHYRKDRLGSARITSKT